MDSRAGTGPLMRITILCEDRMHQQFLEGLCGERGYRIERRDVAPRGDGAGSDYVIKRFAHHVRALRAMGREQRGLLVALDGDNEGFSQRLARLGDQLSEEGLSPRAEEELITILIPKWSIETWVLFLHDGIEVPESEKCKGSSNKEHRATLKRLSADKWGTLKHEASRMVIASWFAGHDSALLPSLRAGRHEASRLELC
jgi:hypothetical protein